MSQHPFVIAAAQIAAVPGDVARNIESHAHLVAEAKPHSVNVLLFPELSLTGYEPSLAARLAFLPGDPRLTPLVLLAREHQMTLVVGAPLAAHPRPHLGALVISATGEITSYSKNHLHPGEEVFFSPGTAPLLLPRPPHTIGVAICADLSHATHPARYASLGANIYAAGVCLTTRGCAADAALLQGYARAHQLLVVMANYYGATGGYDTAGQSAIWAPDGQLLAQASASGDGLVLARSEGDRWLGTGIAVG
jgi:predicted amidohydrolase